MKLRISVYWIKLLSIGLLASTLPVLLLGFFSYWKAVSLIKDKVDAGSTQLLLQYQMRTEQLLKTVDRQVFQLAHTNMVRLAVKEPLTFRHFQSIRQLQTEMKNIQTIDLPITDIALVSLEQGWMINNRGFYSSESSEMDGYRQMKSQSGWSTKARSHTPPNANAEKGEQEEMIYFVHHIPDDYAEPEALLIVSLQGTELNKSASARTELGHMVVLDKEMRVLTHSSEMTPDDLITPLRDFFRGSVLSEQGTITLKYPSENMQIIYRRSDYNGWHYISLISLRKLAMDTKDIGWLAIYTCLGVLSLSLLISIIMMRRVYSPVQRLFSRFVSGDKEPDDRGRHRIDEIKAISERLGSLQQLEHAMKRQMDSQNRQLRDLFLLQLAEGNMNSRDIAEKAALYGFSTDWKQLIVLAADIDSLVGTRYEEKDVHLLLFAIGNIIQEVIRQEQLFHTYTMNHKQFAVICGNVPAEEFMQTIFGAAQDIQAHVSHVLQLEISIGISHLYRELKEVPKACEESMEALKYRILLGQKSIIHFGDLRMHEHQADSRSDLLKKELAEAVKLSDSPRAKHLFHQLMDVLHTTSSGYREYQLALLCSLIDIAGEVFPSSDVTKLLISYESSPMEHVFELKTAQETEKWFEDRVLTPWIERYQAMMDSRYQKISTAMVELIEQYYYEDLSLDFCASHLNYSPDYLKRVFRREAGMNFSDYLAAHRLKLAKRWLIQTDLSISEIANKLHYSNLQNFSRYFRKMENMSPSEYREHYTPK